MPSERIQRRIDRLLDEAEEAADAHDWQLVRELSQRALALDKKNDDARSMLAMAAEELGTPVTPEVSDEAPVPTPAPQPATPSAFAGGRYEVREFLGEGGKKRVFLAHDSLLDREVAFALIRTEGLDDAGRERITREAQAMGRLGDHPHIVPVLDLGQEDVNGVSQPYIVSQYMAGGSAKDVLAEADGGLPLERTLSLSKGTNAASSWFDRLTISGGLTSVVSPANYERGPSPLGIRLNEVLEARPCVRGRAGLLFVEAVEEGVGRAVVGEDRVVDVGACQRLLEAVDGLLIDHLVGTTHQGEHGALHLADAVDHRWRVISPRQDVAPRAAGGVPVEAHHAGEAVALGGLHPGVAATEAEADGEDLAVRLALAAA